MRMLHLPSKKCLFGSAAYHGVRWSTIVLHMGWHQKNGVYKMASPESAVGVVLYEPYQLFSSFVITNQTGSTAKEHL